MLLKNLKSAKRGAVGGSSGTTAEHLHPVLASSRGAERFWSMCQSFARGDVPEEILQAVRMGRRQATSSDAWSQGPLRSGAQQSNALTTRAGCECIGHILQSETDASPNRTVLSFDGTGAFHPVSRESMMRGWLSMEGGQEVLPIVRQFYGAPSTYLWQDDTGVVRVVHQGEGGEQGDALVPAQFSLLWWPCRSSWDPMSVCSRSWTTSVISGPNRVVPIFNILRRERWTHESTRRIDDRCSKE